MSLSNKFEDTVHEKTHHFDGIQLAMKLWKKDTPVTSIFDENFKPRDFILDPTLRVSFSFLRMFKFFIVISSLQ